ncbi:MAG: hypothetical protein IPG04_23840 [Polyangiaceae bacterium]|nr:hypothetical protein [Polyangiaceae bacterium]
MLASCPRCPGFVPQGADVCPHCGEAASRAPEPSRAARVGASLAKLGGAAAMAVTLMACYGAPGGPWDSECWDDVDCFEGEVCNAGICVLAEDCDNGFDDDGDGLTDLADEDCPEPSTEICGDELDNDGDLAVDCQDSDCSAVCVEDCTNGIDDDADDLIDCQDSASCATCPLTETECGNLFDDDQDGLTDCDDLDCEAVCSPGSCGDGTLGSDEQCDDGALLGGDGCSADCAVELDLFCPLVPVLALGDTSGDSSAGNNAFTGTCEGVGRESVYAFTAAAAGTLFVQASATHDVSLAVLPACDPTQTELTCVNATLAGGQELTSVPLVADQTVYVVADSAVSGVGGPFLLTTSFVEQ